MSSISLPLLAIAVRLSLAIVVFHHGTLCYGYVVLNIPRPSAPLLSCNARTAASFSVASTGPSVSRKTTCTSTTTRCFGYPKSVGWSRIIRRDNRHLHTSLFLSVPANDDDTDDLVGDEEGADLAAEFFKLAQEKGIGLDSQDLIEEEEEEEEDEDDDEDEDEQEPNIPQSAINAFLGYDTGDVGEKLAGNVSLTDDQLYSEVKERVLDTAGGFVELVGGPSDDEDEEDDGDGDKPKPYQPPTTVPDSDLTAGEVVMVVLDALLHNDVPEKNKGVEILFGYSSDGSQIKNEVGLTPAEYTDFLKETEYKVLFDHQGASIDKGDYSFDGKKAFFTARLQTGPGPLDNVSVNFILSTRGVEDDACWLVDSMLIRPQSMRRRRRR